MVHLLEDCEFRKWSKGTSCVGEYGYPAGTTYLPGDEPRYICTETGDTCYVYSSYASYNGYDISYCDRLQETNILCPECWKYDLEEKVCDRNYIILYLDKSYDVYHCIECDREFDKIEKNSELYENYLEEFVQNFINKIINEDTITPFCLDYLENKGDRIISSSIFNNIVNDNIIVHLIKNKLIQSNGVKQITSDDVDLRDELIKLIKQKPEVKLKLEQLMFGLI